VQIRRVDVVWELIQNKPDSQYYYSKNSSIKDTVVTECKTPGVNGEWCGHCTCFTITGSPAGLIAVLMASAIVVLKHETSTLRQSHNSISIDLTLGMGDYVRVCHQPCQIWFGSNERSLRHVGVAYTGTSCDWFFIFSDLYSSTELQPIPVNQFTRTIAQKTRSGVRKTLLGMRNV